MQVVLSVGHGTTHIRTHVDIDTETGLAGVVGVMATRERLRDTVDIEIVAFPQSAMLVSPRTTGPASRPVPQVKRLREAGVMVCSGNDGIRDTWGLYGNGDMLERAMLVGLRNNLRRDDELELALDICTYGGV